MDYATTAPPPAREPVPDRHFAAQGTRRPVHLSQTQADALAADLGAARITYDDEGHPHVQGWDVRATLTRIFGFGMWSELITERRLIQERQVGNTWHVSWAVSVLLTCWDPHGTPLGPFEGTTIETAAMPQLGGAHELARKAAATIALKRAAINLGNQFGLSLYRKMPHTVEDQWPRTSAVSGTLQPVTVEAGDRSPTDLPAAQHSEPEPGDVTVPNAAAAVNRPAGADGEHTQSDDTAPVTAPSAPARPRTVDDIVKPVDVGAAPAAAEPDPADQERLELRALVLATGVDAAAFNAAVLKACGVPLEQATYEQVRRMRAAMESRYAR